MQRSNSEPDPQPQGVTIESNQDQNLGRRSLPRPTSSGFFSFLRWFRKDGEDLNSDSEDENLSRPVSPLFSSTESVSSVFSTATATSFAYVPPNIYKPFGLASQPETLIAPGPDTETYRKRLRQRERLKELDRNLTLRKKYRLYAADTLKNDDQTDVTKVDPKKIKTEDNQNYSDLSLPIPKASVNKVLINGNVVKGHRRSASDSSKDKRAGAYVHVKGKRRAPPPPIKTNNSISQTRSLTISRKKRPAPPPPIKSKEEVIKTEFLKNMDMERERDPTDIPKDKVMSNDSLKLEKGVLKPAKSAIMRDDMSISKEIKDVPPVSPRPWYKRTGNSSKDLKKEKSLDKNKDKENSTFPEVNYYRSSTASDYNPRFSFFSKLNDKNDEKKKDAEKRKSGISMLANISELDREAAAIISSQQAREHTQNDDFDEVPSFLRPHVPDKEVEENCPKSARDLISKFNAITNVTKVTVNSAFVNPKESAKLFPKNSNKPQNTYFLQNSDLIGTPPKINNSPVAETPPMKRSIFSKSGFSKPIPNLTSVDDIEAKLNTDHQSTFLKKSSEIENKVIDDNLDNELPKKFPMKSQSSVNLNSSINWTCKNCSSQNPHWKGVCSGCNLTKEAVNESKLNTKVTESPKSRKRTLGDWEKELKKYFPAKTRNSLCDLKKSSSDKSVFKPINESVNKSLVNKNQLCKLNENKTNEANNFNITKNKEFKVNNESSLNKTLVNPNMEEVRKIRLERFSANLDNMVPSPSHDESDMNEQSRLFEKLREMKNSLPKQHLAPQNVNFHEPKIINKPSEKLPPFMPAIQPLAKDDNIKFGAVKKNQILNDTVSENKPELTMYVVTTHTEFDDIKIKNENANKPLKVSSSCQTSGIIRKLEPTNKTTITESPVHIQPDNNQAPELKIRNRTYELIRPRDFMCMKNAKINPIYVEPSNKYNKVSQSQVQSSDFDVLTEELRLPKSQSCSNLPFKNRDSLTNNTLEVNKLLKSLETAIAEGRQMDAARLAKDLANLKVNCSVIRQQNVNDGPSSSNTGPVIVTLDLYVEDKLSHQGPILLQIPKCMTLLGLKRKILHDFEIPIAIQRWILGNQLASDDTRTLEEYGIRESGTPIYLYLVAPGERNMPEGDAENPNANNKIIVKGPSLIPPDMKRNYSNLSDIKEIDSRSVSESDFSLNDTDCFDISEYSCNGLTDEGAELKSNTPKMVDWICTACTVNNYSLNPNCTACNARKPIPDEIKQLENHKDEHYMQLLNLDSKDIVSNLEPFSCSVCFDNFVAGEGIVLRECLHTFCRECLTNTVKYAEEPEVRCPFRNEQYACNYVLQEREIKALVSKDIYEQHLAKSIMQAENKIENAFHCKTPNCLGWCIFEDNVNLFHCPVCSNSNCLTCQAIHTNLDCRQYQEKMKQDSETNADAKRTKDMLKDLVDKGEAMTCPTCQVILMKKWGCDWLRCSMCKTEICWVTRGPRWGPNGKGDTSAGCRCGIDGKKCHAKCNYCH